MSREIEFGGRKIKPSIRHLYDMKEVVYDREWLEDADNLPLYYMYRDVYEVGDRETILRKKLRYDITVMPARKLGKEFVKTKGHYHAKTNSMTYPEIYGVLEGRAHYLLQKGRDGSVDRVVLIEAEKGDVVVIPPNYAHITINPSERELKMANWVYRDFDSVYAPILERRGGAWFELVDGFVRNENYRKVPELERFSAPKLDMFQGAFYDLIKSPEKLGFLTNPEENRGLFDPLSY